MKEIYNLGLCEDTIKCMLDIVPSIINISDSEVIEKEAILKKWLGVVTQKYLI
ncbi:MAG: hypothetical protein L6V81_01520 [Clostridium sp.]|nr:MAG: hypothetical protein L6V81_01520 [Clostridium sp.]